MIKLTRLNNAEFVINAQLIKFVEARPDTIITLLNEEKIVVREPVDEIVRRVIAYEKSIRFFAR